MYSTCPWPLWFKANCFLKSDWLHIKCLPFDNSKQSNLETRSIGC